MMRAALAAALTLPAGASPRAADLVREAAGTSSAEFLRVGVGARAVVR